MSQLFNFSGKTIGTRNFDFANTAYVVVLCFYNILYLDFWFHHRLDDKVVAFVNDEISILRFQNTNFSTGSFSCHCAHRRVYCLPFSLFSKRKFRGEEKAVRSTSLFLCYSSKLCDLFGCPALWNALLTRNVIFASDAATQNLSHDCCCTLRSHGDEPHVRIPTYEKPVCSFTVATLLLAT